VPRRSVTRKGGSATAARRAAARSAPTRTGARRTTGRRSPRTLGSALLATAAATVVPGTGHLMLRRRRTGALILGVFLLAVVSLVLLVFTARRSALLTNLLSTRVLVLATAGCLIAAVAWIAVIVRTYLVARPRGLDAGRQAIGVVVVTVLCLVIAAPFGFAANLANSQRHLLDDLFTGGGGTSVAEAISKPRLNVLLVGSDAGPDRTGTRTDTMMVASIDTTSGRTTLFSLPRNIGYAQFPPGTPMAEKFPKGFHDPNGNSLSGDYLLNAIYAYAHEHPELAPSTPTPDPGLNMLHQTVGYMLGLQLDYYVEVNMAGFSSIIDALGGVTVDVGPTPLPIGGVLPDGRHVKPDGYVPAGVQQLDGEQALWFARSRRDSDDYTRMGRQRCLLQSILQQKSPTDVITNFQDIAAATTDNVSTNIPQQVLPALVSLAGDQTLSLESVSFDPNLPDPSRSDGKFDTGHVDVAYMRQVVQESIDHKPGAAPAAPTTPPTTSAAPTTKSKARDTASATPTVAPSAAPESLATSCG
jgi:polyisoprenyl-teichoic acid--peptidoglycan teichoic acid transferase